MRIVSLKYQKLSPAVDERRRQKFIVSFDLIAKLQSCPQTYSYFGGIFGLENGRHSVYFGPWTRYKDNPTTTTRKLYDFAKTRVLDIFDICIIFFLKWQRPNQLFKVYELSKYLNLSPLSILYVPE